MPKKRGWSTQTKGERAAYVTLMAIVLIGFWIGALLIEDTAPSMIVFGIFFGAASIAYVIVRTRVR